MGKKDKINFDLDFLDSNAKEKPKHNTNDSKDPNWVFYNDKSKSESDYKEGPSKNWLWVFGVIGFLILIGIFSGDSSTTSTPNSSSSAGKVQVGHYMCDSYYANQADNLAPNSYVASSLSSDSDQLDATSASLDRERSQIENEYVDEYSQYSIDQHNERIDEYNAKLQRYKRDLATYNANLSSYNTKVDTYNNYLQANCTPN